MRKSNSFGHLNASMLLNHPIIRAEENKDRLGGSNHSEPNQPSSLINEKTREDHDEEEEEDLPEFVSEYYRDKTAKIIEKYSIQDRKSAARNKYLLKINKKANSESSESGEDEQEAQNFEEDISPSEKESPPDLYNDPTTVKRSNYMSSSRDFENKIKSIKQKNSLFEFKNQNRGKTEKTLIQRKEALASRLRKKRARIKEERRERRLKDLERRKQKQEKMIEKFDYLNQLLNRDLLSIERSKEHPESKEIIIKRLKMEEVLKNGLDLSQGDIYYIERDLRLAQRFPEQNDPQSGDNSGQNTQKITRRNSRKNLINTGRSLSYYLSTPGNNSPRTTTRLKSKEKQNPTKLTLNPSLSDLAYSSDNYQSSTRRNQFDEQNQAAVKLHDGEYIQIHELVERKKIALKMAKKIKLLKHHYSDINKFEKRRWKVKRNYSERILCNFLMKEIGKLNLDLERLYLARFRRGEDWDDDESEASGEDRMAWVRRRIREGVEGLGVKKGDGGDLVEMGVQVPSESEGGSHRNRLAVFGEEGKNDGESAEESLERKVVVGELGRRLRMLDEEIKRILEPR